MTNLNTNVFHLLDRYLDETSLAYDLPITNYRAGSMSPLPDLRHHFNDPI